MDHLDGPDYCKVCRKWTNGPTQMEDHLRGKNHKKKKRLLLQLVQSYVSFLVTDMTEKISLQLVSGLWPCVEEVTSRIGSFVRGGSFISTAVEIVVVFVG